jgi:uncharacterized protein (TIGR03435 family)
MTVQNVILAAYGLHPSELIATDSPILKQPIDIIATAGRAATTAEMQHMLQPLLAERFKLAVHRENREVDAYVIVRVRTDRLGPLMTRSFADCGRIGETNAFAREEVTQPHPVSHAVASPPAASAGSSSTAWT